MNNPSGAGMPPQQTSPVVTKRRSRKKKPVEVDPEAERQEAELRAKIKASLHTQQASRKEFEDDEANQNQSVLNSKMISAMNNSANINNMNNMHMTNMMGYMSQMGGMGMGNMMQNNQYAQQMYGQYNQNNNMMGMGTILSEAQMNNLELQMQQMKQQLEFQTQQLEQQMKMKQQMEMQQQMEGGGMQQQNQQYPNNGNMDCSGGIDNNNLNAQYQQQNCSPQPQMLQTNPQFHQPQSPYPGGNYTNQQTQYSPNNNVSYNQQSQQQQQQQHQQQQQQSPYNISYNQQQLSESQQSYNPLPFKNQQNNNDSQYNNTSNEPIVDLTSSNEKSLALSSVDESWLKGSVGFHSVGNMSASFNSMGGGMLDNSLSQQNMPNNVVVESSGETSNETSIEGSPQTVDAVQQQAQAGLKTGESGATTSQTNNNKHAAYTDSIAGLKPIQENEADEGDNKFGQSSLMLSLLEGEFMQSVTDDGMNHVMSLDSTTIEALMKKSQSGTDTSLSFADLIGSANTDQTASALTHKLTSSEQQHQQQGSAHVSFAAQASGSTNKDVNESHSSCDPSSSSSHSNNSQYLQIKMGGSSSSIHSSVSMEDAQKDNPPPSATAQMAGATTNRRGSNESGNNKECGASDPFAKRGSRASKKKSISKANVMSSISQWTSDNPFAEADANDDLSPRSQNGGGGDGQSGQPVGQHTSKRLSQSEYSFDIGTGSKRLSQNEDMGDFNSVGASLNSLDISMMSAMTDEIGDSMRGLDISGRSEFMRKQSK